MNLLYIQEQGCGITVGQERLLIRSPKGMQSIQLPLLQGILIFSG